MSTHARPPTSSDWWDEKVPSAEGSKMARVPFVAKTSRRHGHMERNNHKKLLTRHSGVVTVGIREEAQ